MPSRHYAAYIIGLFPSIYDWAVNITGRSPLQPANGDPYNANFPQGSAGFLGVLAWKRGSLLVSLIWVAMIVMVLDRKWVKASIWALVGSLFAVFGIIHVPNAGFGSFASPTIEQCYFVEDLGTWDCWDYAYQWMFFVAYAMLMITFMLIELSRRYLDKSLEAELDDPSAHAFDDWFKDAAKGSEDGSVDSSDPKDGKMEAEEVESEENDPTKNASDAEADPIKVNSGSEEDYDV